LATAGLSLGEIGGVDIVVVVRDEKVMLSEELD